MKSTKLYTVSAALAAAISLAGCTGSTPSSSPSPQAPMSPVGTVATKTPSTPARAVPSTATLLTSFGDGTWLVGKQIAYGTYQSIVPPNKLCLWTLLRTPNNTFQGTIANATVAGGGQATVDITRTAQMPDGSVVSVVAFSSQDCNTWHLVK